MRKLTLALVNNMPDLALERTERQFRALLERAAEGCDLHLRVFMLPGEALSETACAYARTHCEDLAALWQSGGVDGLIVTGAEPRSPAIEDEPFWPALCRLLAWAEECTASTMLSCQAAHAAVLFFDGIRRRTLPAKLFGLYEDQKAADHPLTAGLPPRWQMPQSRYNDIAETELTARGYSILSRSAEAGADICACERKSLFLFLQGHPEYDADALLREYRRDIRRFLIGARDTYPDMPESYFAPSAMTALYAFAARARRERDIRLIAEFPATEREKTSPPAWDDVALRLFRNWLDCIAARSTPARAKLAGAQPDP